MKQGSKYIKTIMIVLTVMVVSYIVYNVIHSMTSGVPTTQAVLFSATEGMESEGFLVRSETVLTAKFPLILPEKAEGEKVAAGAQVAVSLRSTQAQTRQRRITQIEEEIRQLESAIVYQSQLTDNAAVTAKIDEAGASFAAHVAQGRLESAASVGQSLKSLILRQELGTDDTAALQNQITNLQRELGNLQSGVAGDTEPVTAEKSGYYSWAADGYETILTPETISDMTVEQLESLWNAEDKPNVPANAAGRLIASPEWYYAAVVDLKKLETIQQGSRLRVILEGDTSLELRMQVVRLERSGGEKGLLVLSCDRSLAEISDQRRVKATIIFHTYNGVRVPKEAVCYDAEDDTAGVYILENGKACWKSVTLLYDVGDAYIAELDQTSTGNLWPGDLILPNSNNLYDGKVMER